MASNWNDTVCLASGRDASMGADFGWNPFKTIRSVGKKLGGAISSAGSAIKKVPVVGSGLHAVYSLSTSPISLSANIAAGDNVLKSTVKNFKQNLTAVKDVAPYVQTIVSFVPGIGTAAAGVIGGATALAQGRPIDEALIEGIGGALPGGAATQAVFRVGIKAVKGKPPTQEDLKDIPISEDQKKAIVITSAAVKDLADGKPVDEVAFKRGMEALPPEYQKALSTGLTIAQAEKLQKQMKIEASSGKKKLYDAGKAKVQKDPVMNVGATTLKGDVQQGFIVGAGMAGYRFSPTELNAVRGSMSASQKKGLDIALSTHVGRMVKPVKNHKLDPKIKFGYYAASGMRNAKHKNQVEMKKTLAEDAMILHGVVGAKKTQEKEKNLKFLSIWDRLKYIITGR